MRTLVTTLSLAGTLLVGSAALAQTAVPAPARTDMPPPPPGGMRGPGGGGLGALMRADANGDGVITRAEATAQADQQFDRMDANKDGKVTGEERQAARDRTMQRRGGQGADAPPPPPPGGAPMGKRMDPDGDGAITRDEYRARALRRFDRMDTNHDGRIDATEIAAIRQRMMERRGDFGPAPAPGATPTP